MPENQARGDVFLGVMDQVIKKWGNDGLREIDADPNRYDAEQWYPFIELCKILRNIKTKLGNNNPLTIYQLGFLLFKDGPDWQGIFDDRDPAEIFLSTEKQDTQFRAGSQNIKRIGEKHVRVDMFNWGCDDVWYDFFRGQLQGVLELSGRTGVVHLIPGTTGEGIHTLDIKWG